MQLRMMRDNARAAPTAARARAVTRLNAPLYRAFQDVLAMRIVPQRTRLARLRNPPHFAAQRRLDDDTRALLPIFRNARARLNNIADEFMPRNKRRRNK